MTAQNPPSEARSKVLLSPAGAPHARILGVGGYRPSRVVTNEQICQVIDSTDEWIRTRTGIEERRWATAEETVGVMALASAGKALAAAGIEAEQIGCVVISTVTHLSQTPSLAADVANQLGAVNAAAFDISAACAGFCHGLALAQDMVRGGSAEYVLVIGVERLSDLTDMNDRSTAFIFGDQRITHGDYLVRAERLAGQALAASPRSGLAHYAKGEALRARHRYGEAIPEYEMALAFNRYLLGAYAPLGWCKLHTGSMDQTIRLAEQAIRLSPRDPFIGNWYFQTGAVHLLQSRTSEAITWFEMARSINPVRPIVHAHLASAYALKGETEHAVAELAEARRLSGDDRYLSIGRLKAVGYFGATKIRALHEATYFAGLRKAGMPED